MDRLAGDPQGVPDLLPRPAEFAGGGDLVRLDPLGQPVQRQGSAKPDRRVIRGEMQVQILDVHVVSLD